MTVVAPEGVAEPVVLAEDGDESGGEELHEPRLLRLSDHHHGRRPGVRRCTLNSAVDSSRLVFKKIDVRQVGCGWTSPAGTARVIPKPATTRSRLRCRVNRHPLFIDFFIESLIARSAMSRIGRPATADTAVDWWGEIPLTPTSTPCYPMAIPVRVRPSSRAEAAFTRGPGRSRCVLGAGSVAGGVG